jgi:hypothetical protein
MKKSAMMVLHSIALLLAFTATSYATVITNGDFSQGLTGWDTDPSAAVSVSNGIASLQIQPSYGDITLSQHILLPSDVTTFSFSVDFINGVGRTVTEIGQPNFLQVIFLPDNENLAETDFLGFDKNGAYNANLDPIANTSAGVWYLFSQDISSLAGLPGTLYYYLADRGDAYQDIAKVKDIVIAEKENNPIPEPSTWVLLVSGLLGLPLLRYRKN